MTTADCWMTPRSEKVSTLLYGLEPKALGTGQVQSANDYLCSLSYRHRATLTQVLNLTLEAGGKPGRRLCAMQHYGRDCHGVTSLAGTVARGLITLCGREDVRGTSLTPLKDFIAGEALLSEQWRLCPACFQAAPDSEIPHGRLLWRLKAVEVCPIHGTTLVTPDCAAPVEQQLSIDQRVVLEGVCPKCGSIGRRCCAATVAQGSKEQVWVAEQVASLIARQTEIESFGLTAFKLALRERYLQVPGELRKLSKRCGLNPALLSHFVQRPTARIGLGSLLRVAAAEGYDLVDLMLGRFVRVHESVALENSPRMRHEVPGSWEEIAEMAQQAERKGMTRGEFTRSIGVHDSSFRKHLPEEARALAQNTFRRAQSLRTKKQDEELKEVERTATKALRKHLPLTLRVASELTGAIWYPSQPRAQYLAAIRCALSGKTYQEKQPWSQALRQRVSVLIERLQRIQVELPNAGSSPSDGP